MTEVEGYPGLIVHGPLMATLLLDLHRRHSDASVRSFKFRAMRPVFDIAPFRVCGDGTGSLWIRDPDGFVAMEAEAG